MERISSSGVLFLYLAGMKSGDQKIYTRQVDSYQHPFDFYYQVKGLEESTAGEVDIEVFCILGTADKVDSFASEMRNNITANFEKIIQEEEITFQYEDSRFIEKQFNKLLQEHIFRGECVRFPWEHRTSGDSWAMHCFWAGEGPDDELHMLLDDVVGMWLNFEQPHISGRQVMIHSFLFRDLGGRKIIGAFPEPESREWCLLLEGGVKLHLREDHPYFRERLGTRDIGQFTTTDIDSIVNNPIYAYGKGYLPMEIYEEWHKVFLFAAAVMDCEWNRERIVPVYEHFLQFMEENICETLPAETMLDKALYWEELLISISGVREYLRGKEETVISKDLLLLLNSRYSYLPYLYDLMEKFSWCGKRKKTSGKFSREHLEELVHLSEVSDTYQRGVRWEDAAEYFLSHIRGLKISGRRVRAGVQEIDLSLVNVSLDSQLWEMGPYILAECKNWSRRIGIQVIRGLVHIASMKGNRVTLLFAASGISKDAQNEIFRAAIDQNFILTFTKEDLLKVSSEAQCYECLTDKWKRLLQDVENNGHVA